MRALAEDSDALILVVDDEPDIRRLMVLGLQRRGYRTAEAADGEEALAVVQGTPVDMVLLDSGLPKLSGPEVLRRLRADPRFSTLPVIVITGRSDITDKVVGLAAGANDYLTKPVHLEELFARIEANLRGHRMWIERMTERLHSNTELVARLAAGLAGGDVRQHIVDTLAELPHVAGVAFFEISPIGVPAIRCESRAGAFSVIRAGALRDPRIADEFLHLIADGASILPVASSRSLLGPGCGRLVASTIGHTGSDTSALLIAMDPTAPNQAEIARELLGRTLELAPIIDNMMKTVDPTPEIVGLTEVVSAVIESAAFDPVFQPICDIATGEIVGYEALTRFRDGASPEIRFHDARFVGLGGQLERATLRAALLESRRLPADRYVSINLSATLLGHPELAEMLDLCGERQLYIEITEHEQIDDYERVLDEFHQLGRGLRLSVDDAGSGWSSLRHVFMLRPHIVKLDKSWIADLDRDPARPARGAGIARFAGELGGDIVAEGIETEAELRAVGECRIRFGQGYLLGRPASVAELTES